MKQNKDKIEDQSDLEKNIEKVEVPPSDEVDSNAKDDSDDQKSNKDDRNSNATNVKEDVSPFSSEEYRDKSIKTPISIDKLISKFGNRLLIHGMPGVGKSTFIERLKERPNTVAIDTDDFIDGFEPKFKLSKIPEEQKKMVLCLQAAYYKAKVELILLNPQNANKDIIILTNFWSKDGFPPEFLTKSGKIPLSVVQPDVDDAMAVIKDRHAKQSKTKSELTTNHRMYSSWLNNILTNGSQQIANFIYLKQGNYLSDVITI